MSGTFANGALTLDWDFLNTTLQARLEQDALVGTYRNNRAGANPQDVRMRRFKPIASGGGNLPRWPATGRCGGIAEEVTAPRDTRTWHVFLRQSGAEVVGHDSSRRRRHRHAGGTLAGRQARAQPLRRRAPEPVRSDAQRRRHAGGDAERQRALPGGPQRRGARQGHSRAARSVALHEREGSDRAVPFRVSRSRREDRVEQRCAVPRQGGHPRDRRQLVPELPRRGAVPRPSCTRIIAGAGSRSSA